MPRPPRSPAQPRQAAFRHLLVGYDGSAGSRRALHASLTLARLSSASLAAVTVQPHLPRSGATVGEVDEAWLVEQQQVDRITAEIHAHTADSGITVTTRMRRGHPGQEIVREAVETGADLIVLGHSGHSAVHDRLLGSVAETVSRHAPCSVLIVR